MFARHCESQLRSARFFCATVGKSRKCPQSLSFQEELRGYSSNGIRCDKSPHDGEALRILSYCFHPNHCGGSGFQSARTTCVSDYPAKTAGLPKLFETFTIFKQNALDELKLIVGECAPKSRSSKSWSICGTCGGWLRQKQFGKGVTYVDCNYLSRSVQRRQRDC